MNLKVLTWCSDLSSGFLFFLADEVTRFLSLYTINVSSAPFRESEEIRFVRKVQFSFSHSFLYNKLLTKDTTNILSIPALQRELYLFIKWSAMFCIVHSNLPPEALQSLKKHRNKNISCITDIPYELGSAFENWTDNGNVHTYTRTQDDPHKIFSFSNLTPFLASKMHYGLTPLPQLLASQHRGCLYLPGSSLASYKI